MLGRRSLRRSGPCCSRYFCYVIVCREFRLVSWLHDQMSDCSRQSGIIYTIFSLSQITGPNNSKNRKLLPSIARRLQVREEMGELTEQPTIGAFLAASGAQSSTLSGTDTRDAKYVCELNAPM